ncbi:hypothetical protein SAMN05444349_11227 [Bacteroides faecichinchillae]|uniref:Uncharacterized protein n=1 Tax=Bacteroides faecichinchillae TaxID=871325 RepID=A0A1M4ZAL0_9BACE|nr:hypothetical protein SAMN05444349_11227 [Bacteroides faecichinchillae]
MAVKTDFICSVFTDLVLYGMHNLHISCEIDSCKIRTFAE